MNRTEIALVGAIIVIFGYEIIALVRKEPTTPTISRIVWDASSNRMLPFAFGLLMGHFFWQRAYEPCAAVVASLFAR